MFKKNFTSKTVLGLTEPITIENTIKCKAKIDTGADYSSIDRELLKKIFLKKENKTDVLTNLIEKKRRIIKNTLGKESRKIIILNILIKEHKLKKKFTITNRQNLKYKILIGKNILKTNKFLIDPDK